MSSKATVAFVFPGLIDHVEATLPVCRGLVKWNLQVDYVCDAAFRDAIEETGAIFHDVADLCADHGMNFQKTLADCLAEYADENGDGADPAWGNIFGSIATEKLIPVFLDFFRSLSPKVIVYCPLRCPYAHFASELLRIRDVSLLIAPGPGSMMRICKFGDTASQVAERIRSNAANAKAVEGIRNLMKKGLSLNTVEPLCHENYTQLNLVATLQSLADPLSERDACVYFAQGKKFEFLGPLRDPLPEETCGELMDEIREAVYTRSDIVYVSLGQITGDDPVHGWNASSGDNLLTGKQICHAISRVVFRQLGKASGVAPGPTPLVIFTVGKHGTREDLELLGLEVPENCHIFSEALYPEVQVLQAARPALFVTDGFQGHSLFDALRVGSPMMIIPCHEEEAKTKLLRELGVALQVAVPSVTSFTDIESPMGSFEALVGDALEELLGTSRRAFRWNAQALAAEIRDSGGAERAVDLIQEVIPRSKRGTLRSWE